MTEHLDSAAPLTLCATELQARLLRAQYQREQSAAGRTAWESPAILSLGRWIREQWLADWPTQELISRSKERWLWQELIRADSCHERLLAPESLADQFTRVWRECQHWQITPADEPLWTPEQELFARLYMAFNRELERRAWITDAQLAQVTLHTLQREAARIPTQVHAWGFDPSRMHRTEMALLETLKAEPASIPVATAQPVIAHRHDNPGALWKGLADAVVRTLKNQPDARIVVAVPRLSQHADSIDVHWAPHLAPQLASSQPSEDTVRPWVIEQPRPLGDYPVIGALLDVCRLAPQGMDFPQLSTLLRQSFFFSPEERLFTTVAERRLREAGLRFASTDLHGSLPSGSPTRLKSRLHALAEVIEQQPRAANGSDWVAHWQRRWQALPLADSNPHWGIREDLQQALAGFISLADEMGILTPTAALQTFQQVLQDHMHSQRQTHDVRVLVCESSQALGLPCSHLFVSNLDAQHFPSPRPMNPWLNPALLAAVEHPQSSPQHWLQQQKKLLEELCRQPQTAGLHYAAHDDSGTPQNPTPLLPLDWQAAALVHSDGDTAAPELVWLEQDTVSPLSPERLAQQTGGSNLIRRQSASPFAAFAYNRLRSRELPPPPLGLSTARQGEWVHAVLAAFWESQRDSRTLAALADDDVLAILQTLIDQTRGRYLPLARYGAALQTLEGDRVLRLCSRWIQHERKRTDPFVVLHCEAPYTAERCGLPLKLRIDRIDRVQTEYGERYLVIDYKTGQADMNGWRGEVLREPQLPLYATGRTAQELGVPTIDGICFARVHEQRPALLAASNWCQRLTTDSTSDKEWKYIWDEEIAAWEQQLDMLIQSFRDGEIRHRTKTTLASDFGLRAAAFLLDDADEDFEGVDA